MTFLELREVSKSFGTIEVLPPLSLLVEKGEFVVLVGPSGCGKSTLIRMIAGLEEVSGGDVMIEGGVVNENTPIERDVAMVFQNYALYPHMSVRKNIGFALRMAGQPKAEIATRVEATAKVMGLGDLLDRFPKQLSGGQRQRVAMGRAIVREPKLFLFDEPLSNLDAKLRVQMRSEIRRLHELINTTTLYVTHDQVEAMTLANKVVVMCDGRIEQVGRPIDIYDYPETLFVAGFIGSPAMNIFAAFVVAGKISLPGGGSWSCAPAGMAGNIMVGVRPEHLQVANEGLAVNVTAVENTGAETVLVCQADLDKGGSFEILVSMRNRPSIATGERIHLMPQEDKLHYFRPESGRRWTSK